MPGMEMQFVVNMIWKLLMDGSCFKEVHRGFGPDIAQCALQMTRFWDWARRGAEEENPGSEVA